jgi:hypothetical protein
VSPDKTGTAGNSYFHVKSFLNSRFYGYSIVG